MFIFTYQSKYPPHPPLPHTTRCTGHVYQSVAASTSAFGPFFLSSFLQGGKVVKKKSVMKTRQHHRRRDGAAAPATTTASLVFRGTVRPFVPSETAVQPAVRTSSSSSSSLRRVLDAFLSLSFEHHHQHLLLHIVKSLSSVVWKAFSTRNKVSCFPMRGVNSRYHHHHHHHLSLYIYKGSVRIRRRRPLRRPLPRASFAALFLLPR